MLVEEPIKKILIETRLLWDHTGTRPSVRESFNRMTQCRTPALGWRTYASDMEEKFVYHTCKARPCSTCGYRATLSWQRELWTQLPDVAYAGVVLTMPNVLWAIFKRNRHLLHDLPTMGAEVISQWMKEKYGVCPFILVVQHTFGRHLDFKPHLHVLMSAGGLAESERRWTRRLPLNPVAFMKMWRYGLIKYLRLALNAGILKSDLSMLQLKHLLRMQYERNWHVHLDRQVSKAHFLGYAARYVRKPPIAQHRFQEIGGPFVKFLTKDTRTKKTVLDVIPKEEFVKILADHTPDKYLHAVRYYGLLSPRARGRSLNVIFALLGQKRRQRPVRLSWAQMIIKYFGRNPLVDSRGSPMRLVGRYFPVAA